MVKIFIKIEVLHFSKTLMTFPNTTIQVYNHPPNSLSFHARRGKDIGKGYYLETKRNRNFPNIIRRLKQIEERPTTT